MRYPTAPVCQMNFQPETDWQLQLKIAPPAANRLHLIISGRLYFARIQPWAADSSFAAACTKKLVPRSRM